MSEPRRLDDLLFGPDAPTTGVAVHEDGHTTSWDQLREHINARPREMGAAPITRRAVAIELGNTATCIAAWFAVWRAGGVVMPLNPRVTDAERRQLLDSTRPTMHLDSTGLHPVAPDDQQEATFGGDVALVSFTSGTTGPPKAVPLRHDRVLTLMDGVLATIRGATTGATTGSERTSTRPTPMPNLIPVSLSLWAGIYNVLFAFRVGSPVVLMDRFETGRFAELVAQHAVRSTVLPPAAMVMLADDPAITDLRPLRLVRSISAPLSPLQAGRFRDRFDITVLNGYGQTELGGEVIGWSASDGRAFGATKLGAVGRPHDGIEVRVVGDDGTVLGAEGVGDLEIRTATGPSADVDLGDRMSDDGFLRTGDLGRIDADGFVWIEGRRSEMVNRGGLKVFPAHVEEVLLLHADVEDVAVVGESDDRLGEIPVAYVVPRDGTSVDPTALERHCRGHLAAYKVPVRFAGVERIPRNDIGKVQRHLL